MRRHLRRGRGLAGGRCLRERGRRGCASRRRAGLGGLSGSRRALPAAPPGPVGPALPAERPAVSARGRPAPGEGGRGGGFSFLRSGRVLRCPGGGRGCPGPEDLEGESCSAWILSRRWSVLTRFTADSSPRFERYHLISAAGPRANEERVRNEPSRHTYVCHTD